MQAIGMCINSNALKPLSVLMSATAHGRKSIGLITSAALQPKKERHVQRCVMSFIVTTALTPSETGDKHEKTIDTVVS